MIYRLFQRSAVLFDKMELKKISFDQVQFYHRPGTSSFRIITDEHMFLHVPSNSKQRQSSSFFCAFRKLKDVYCPVKLVVYNDHCLLLGSHSHESKHPTTLFHMKMLACCSKIKISRENLLDVVAPYVQNAMPKNQNVVQECFEKIVRFSVPKTSYQMISGSDFLTSIQNIFDQKGDQKGNQKGETKQEKVLRGPGRPRKSPPVVSSFDSTQALNFSHSNLQSKSPATNFVFASPHFSTADTMMYTNASADNTYYQQQQQQQQQNPNSQHNMNSTAESTFQDNHSHSFQQQLPPQFPPTFVPNAMPSNLGSGNPIMIPLNNVSDSGSQYTAYILLVPSHQQQSTNFFLPHHQ